MPISLGTNIASLNVQRRLAENTNSLARVFERLSSGQRINRASDDAAGLAIAESLRADSRIMLQGVRNLNDGISLLNIADSAIESLSSIVTRLEELAEQAANGTYGVQQRKALDTEAQALAKEFYRISKVTEFNDRRLLSGELGTVALQAGIGTSSVLLTGVGGAIGTGTFNSRTILSSTGAHDVKAADLNGDGIIDLVAADVTNDRINVHIGSGSGSFLSAVAYSAGDGPRHVFLNDFNNDGVMDISTADQNSDTITVLIGLGNGTFQSARTYLVGDFPTSVNAGDFNGDGIIDLVSANYTGDSVSVLLGQGNGTFGTARSFALGNNGHTIISADFNGDNILDLAVTDFVSAVRVLNGRGDGTFSTAISYATGNIPVAAVAADVNGDGHIDLLTQDSGSSVVSVFINNGSGSFAARVSYTSSNGAGLTFGDFNGDGALDLASSGNDQTARILLGNGNGSFAAPTSYMIGNGSYNVITTDLNGDGVLDLVTHDFTDQTLSVLIGQTKEGVAPLLSFSLKTMVEARQAMPILQRKREQLASQRGQIGAYQSRIDVAINVLEITAENFKAAESRIRDADVAEESANLTRLNILQQAAAAVLAQANQQPSIAIQLLGGA